MSVLEEMQADVILKHFGHQSINSATGCCEQHQHISAVMVVRRERSFDTVHLAADSLDPVKQLDFFPIFVRHDWLRNTVPGYTTKVAQPASEMSVKPRHFCAE